MFIICGLYTICENYDASVIVENNIDAVHTIDGRPNLTEIGILLRKMIKNWHRLCWDTNLTRHDFFSCI